MSAAQNINNNFFAGIYKDVWKHLIPAGLTEAETDFIINVSDLKPGNSVLDLMCGYGRHSLELAERGYQVTAIDNSEDYIKEIQLKSIESGIPVNAIEGDILSMNYSGKFDSVICMGNSFAFFDSEGVDRLVRSVAASLNPGGSFILNSWMVAEIAIRHFRDKEWYYAGDYKCLLDSRFLFNPLRIECEQTIIAPDGNTEKVKGIDYIFTIDQITAILDAAGIVLEGLYSTPRKKPFVFGDTRVYIVGKKKF